MRATNIASITGSQIVDGFEAWLTLKEILCIQKLTLVRAELCIGSHCCSTKNKLKTCIVLLFEMIYFSVNIRLQYTVKYRFFNGKWV